MRNIIFLLSISFILFSCQKVNDKKTNNKIVLNLENTRESLDSTSDENNIKVVIELPKDRFARITLEPYIEEESTFYKPLSIKIIDKNTKREIPEIWFEGIYYDNDAGNNDHQLMYGDFNFDGKMDIACQSGYTAYADFNIYNFYLSTDNGYELNKSFSKMTEDPVTIKLDRKLKKIVTERIKDYDDIALYSIKNNILVSENFRQGPFRYNSDFGEIKTTIDGDIIYDKSVNTEEILSFDSSKEKSIKLLFYKNGNEKKTFYYAEIKNDTLVDYCFKGKFIYNQNKGILQFDDNNIKYKIYEDDSGFGIEITNKGKTKKIIGNPNSKIGNLSRIISLKRNEEENKDRDFENIIIEK